MNKSQLIMEIIFCLLLLIAPFTIIYQKHTPRLEKNMNNFCTHKFSIYTGGNLMSEPQPYLCCWNIIKGKTCYDVNINWKSDKIGEIKN
jgi:hypothetical protein